MKLRLNQEETENVEIGRGIRQGSCMTPILQINYIRRIFNEETIN
jgi:hypothetical protein